MSDNRKTNYQMGQNLENEFYNQLTQNSLLNELIKQNIIHLDIKKAGGRNNNYDFMINDRKIEIKNNVNSVYNLPEILQIGCSTIDSNYIKYHFENVIKSIFPEIKFEDYIKNINSIKHEGVFERIYENKDEIEESTKKFINEYLKSELDLNKFSKIVVERLKEQTEKVFMMFKDEVWFSEVIEDNFNKYSTRIEANNVIITTDNNEYKCLLRWKNGIGVNYPAYQISIKHKSNNLISTKDSMLKLSKEEKKEFGIFFTPQVIIDEIISRIKKMAGFQTILEPSCGDGRFIKSLLKTFPEADVKGYELNEKVFSEVKLRFPEVEILNENYLNSPIDEKFDLIIGNPPYFITKDRIYNEYYTGRANIFIQFIIHSLKKLNPEGVLIFVIPETFLNCQYYSKTREFIRREFVIYDIYKNPDMFEDTKYDTITMIVMNVKPQINGLRNENDDWFYNDVIVYDQNLSNLINSKGITINELMKEDSSLEISIGPFVWNQHKNQLIPIDSNEKLPVLIYKPNNLKKRSLVKMKDENDRSNENSNDFIDVSQIILQQ